MNEHPIEHYLKALFIAFTNPGFVNNVPFASENAEALKKFLTCVVGTDKIVFATCAPALGGYTPKKIFISILATLASSSTKKLLILFTASNESAISCVVCVTF